MAKVQQARAPKRSFNTAGPCRPGDHYMLPPEGRLATLRSLIEAKSYVVLHAPRQSGKTTSASLIAEALTATNDYAAVLASCKVASTSREINDRIRRFAGAERLVLSGRPPCSEPRRWT